MSRAMDSSVCAILGGKEVDMINVYRAAAFLNQWPEGLSGSSEFYGSRGLVHDNDTLEKFATFAEANPQIFVQALQQLESSK